MTVAADPYALAFKAGADVLGKALTVPPAGPSQAQLSGAYSFDWDSSGWNVNFGGGTIDSTANKATTKSTDTAAGLPSLFGGSGGSMSWQTAALVGLGVVAVWAAIR